MTIRIDAMPGRRIPHAHVTTALEKALGRLPLHPVGARVTFTDVNGPKKGVDMECALLVTLPARPSLRVVRRAATPRLAFELAYDVLVRRLEQAREQHDDARRRPKKYYGAKRLLA